jgi:hypothetical protein
LIRVPDGARAPVRVASVGADHAQARNRIEGRTSQGLCRAQIRPPDVAKEYGKRFIADEGKTAQFLAAKRLVLDQPSRDSFLDFVARDFFAALDL